MGVRGNGRVQFLINTRDGPHLNYILDILVFVCALLEFMLGDFFDGKHHVMLGGSWATLPRIAGRKSFRNWYQMGYGYVWASGRVVKDLLN